MFPRGKPLPNNPADLDGATKAAIVLVNLNQQSAAALLKCLPQDMVEEVTRVIASLGDIPAGLSSAVIEEFYNVRMANQNGRAGGLSPTR
jgi:flagellar motor switch protein FliG